MVCPTCGVIAELFRTRSAPRPKLCDCPTPESVAPATRPRHCVRCSARLNRYNVGLECGPCKHARTSGTIAADRG